MKKDGPLKAVPLCSKILCVLQYLHVLCLQSLGSLNHIERNRLAFFQAAKTIRLNRGEVDKNIFPIFP